MCRSGCESDWKSIFMYNNTIIISLTLKIVATLCKAFTVSYFLSCSFLSLENYRALDGVFLFPKHNFALKTCLAAFPDCELWADKTGVTKWYQRSQNNNWTHLLASSVPILLSIWGSPLTCIMSLTERREHSSMQTTKVFLHEEDLSQTSRLMSLYLMISIDPL